MGFTTSKSFVLRDLSLFFAKINVGAEKQKEKIGLSSHGNKHSGRGKVLPLRGFWRMWAALSQLNQQLCCVFLLFLPLAHEDFHVGCTRWKTRLEVQVLFPFRARRMGWLLMEPLELSTELFLNKK